MQRLQDDIDWHREQLRLAREALLEADQAENPIRQLEVEMLNSAILKFERTLGHLEELRTKRI